MRKLLCGLGVAALPVTLLVPAVPATAQSDVTLVSVCKFPAGNAEVKHDKAKVKNTSGAPVAITLTGYSAPPESVERFAQRRVTDSLVHARPLGAQQIVAEVGRR
jgi:hypothetical protein